MEASLFRLNGIRFGSNRSWNKWLGGLALISLGGLILIWPLPSLICLAALIMLAGFLIRPYAALIATILLIGFECFTLHYLSAEYSHGYGLVYFIGPLGLLCWGLARLAGVTPPYKSTKLDLPLAVCCITGAISLSWSRYWLDGLHIVIFTILSYSIYLLISALNSKPRDLERLFWLYFGLGNLTVILTVATFFFGYSKLYFLFDHFYFSINILQFKGTRHTLTGVMGVAKAISGILNVSIFCGLTLLCTRVRRSSKGLIFISLLAMLFIHTLTLSRLETMGLFFGWLTFAYLNPQWRNARIPRHLLVAASFLVVILGLLVMLSSFYNVSELLARLAGQEDAIPSAGYRFSAIQGRSEHSAFALGRIWETGGLGAGAGGIMRGFDPTLMLQSPTLHLSFLTDHGYGLLSLMLMGWIMLNLVAELRWALRNCPDPRYRLFIVGVCSFLMVYGTAGIADHIFYIAEMWILLGFAAAAVKGARYLQASPPDEIRSLT
jgi:hypothetical protein